MSFPLKLLTAVVVWLLFYLLTFRGCQEQLCYACDEASTELTAADTVAQPDEPPSYPLYAKWSDPETFKGEGAEAFLSSIADAGEEGQLLEVTGFYYTGEPAPEGFENMGLARAAELAKLFEGVVPEERLQLRARLIDKADDTEGQPFEAGAFSWADSKTSATVEDIGDRILIRFPLGSAERVYDPAVDEYLEKLAARVVETGEAVQLTGHTDNTGTPELNQRLGQDRANAIKRILVSKQVPEAQVTTDSKGEHEPVASNNTEEGRYENRRVEVRLIKLSTTTKND